MTAVAIGGYRSAQSSSAIFMVAESSVTWGSVLPPKLKLCRFRDNVNCLCPTSNLLYLIHTQRGLLTGIYNIPVTVEQVELSVMFLQVQLLCQGTDLQWGFKNKLINSTLTPGSAITRYPDPYEPHARRLVNSIATALGGSTVQVATDHEFSISNLSQAIWEMERRQYAIVWWSHQLKRHTMKDAHTQHCWQNAKEP